MSRFRGIRSISIASIGRSVCLPVGKALRRWYDRWPIKRVPTPRSLKEFLRTADRAKK